MKTDIETLVALTTTDIVIIKSALTSFNSEHNSREKVEAVRQKFEHALNGVIYDDTFANLTPEDIIISKAALTKFDSKYFHVTRVKAARQKLEYALDDLWLNL
jgi:hypothetical protein